MSNRIILLVGSESGCCKRPRCFDQARIGDEVLHLDGVSQALEYLQDGGASAACDEFGTPPLLFVWSSVGVDAISQLLSRVRNDERLTGTPIVVLTSGVEATQASSMSQRSASDYLIRASDTETLLEIVSSHLRGIGPFARIAQTS